MKPNGPSGIAYRYHGVNIYGGGRGRRGRQIYSLSGRSIFAGTGALHSYEPLPARLVEDYNALCRYPYCAHSVIPGRRKKDFQDMEYILPLFNEKVATARRRYREFGQKSIARGRRPLILSAGAFKEPWRMGFYQGTAQGWCPSKRR